MAKSTFDAAETLSGWQRFSLGDLSTLTGLSSRTIRQLIDLGAIDRAQWPNSRRSYDMAHLRQVKLARSLLRLGLSANEVARYVAELSPTGRPPAALNISFAPSATASGIGWFAGDVELSFPHNRSSAEERLLKCIRLAVQEFVQQERAIRRCVRSNV